MLVTYNLSTKNTHTPVALAVNSHDLVHVEHITRTVRGVKNTHTHAHMFAYTHTPKTQTGYIHICVQETARRFGYIAGKKRRAPMVAESFILFFIYCIYGKLLVLVKPDASHSHTKIGQLGQIIIKVAFHISCIWPAHMV